MTFSKEYNLIKSVVKDDLAMLESDIASLFFSRRPLDDKLLSLLTAPAKRLRPLLGFLFLRASGAEIIGLQRDALVAVELIHNATLIHDDVIDSADNRRGEETINAEFDDNLAVVAGDYLLSVALEKVLNTNSIEVIKLFALALKNTCLGEINQYFSKFKIPAINDYIEKSREKTALLFELAVVSCLELCPDVSADKKLDAKNFAQNFGIAFQIRDDLINVLKFETLKTSDINEGIYTAPIIFAAEENPDLLKSENLSEELKNTKSIEKTKDLMDNYFEKAANMISKLDESVYKNSLLDIINLLKKSV